MKHLTSCLLRLDDCPLMQEPFTVTTDVDATASLGALLHRRVAISSGAVVSSDFELDTMRTRTGLDRVALRDALTVLMEGSPEACSIRRDAFADGLVAIAASASTTTPVHDVVRIANFLFDLFDDGVASVGLAEITSGLAALCTASPRMEKLRLAFELYDEDDSNSILPHEMERYLTAVFRVAFATQPGVQASMGGISASDLAARRAGDAFREADSNGSGELTWGNFFEWASKHVEEEVLEVASVAPLAVSQRLITPRSSPAALRSDALCGAPEAVCSPSSAGREFDNSTEEGSLAASFDSIDALLAEKTRKLEDLFWIYIICCILRL